MSWPERIASGAEALDFTRMSALTFEQPERARFPGLFLAWEALEAVAGTTAVLNAANEVAVEAFVNGSLSFLGIFDHVTRVMNRHRVIEQPTLEQILEADRVARQTVHD